MMVLTAANVIQVLVDRECPGAEVELVSGGAAWTDHAAVSLFLRREHLLPIVSGLTIYAPCEFVDGRFKDTGVRASWKNPGGAANYYHDEFNKHRKVIRPEDDSFLEIQQAIDQGAVLIPGAGFKSRNTDVSNVQALVAFTYGAEAFVKDGGTLDTCAKYAKRISKEGLPHFGFHVCLPGFGIYRPFVV